MNDDLSEKQVTTIRTIVRDETIHLATVAQLDELGTELRGEISGLKDESKRTAFLMEDTRHMVKGMLGMLSDSLENKMRLNDIEDRVATIEAERPLFKSTLALHSKQLRTQLDG